MFIRVEKPFRLRTVSGVREFGRGEHVLSESEAEHWAMRAWLTEGRYRVLSGDTEQAAEASAPSPVTPKSKKKKANA